MNKITITTLLLCTGLIAAGCEKTYSVAEFKKDPKLMEEWGARCGFTGTSKNCENLRVAGLELEKERRAKISEENRKRYEEFEAEQKARHEKWKADFEKRKAELEKRKAEEKARERAEEEQEAKERAKREAEREKRREEEAAKWRARIKEDQKRIDKIWRESKP